MGYDRGNTLWVLFPQSSCSYFASMCVTWQVLELVEQKNVVCQKTFDGNSKLEHFLSVLMIAQSLEER